jgi:hypothetical protein
MSLAFFEVKIFAKKGPFRGVPPAVAPEGDLVFGEKAESPLTLFKRKLYICTADWASGMCNKTLKSFLRVEAT